MTIELYTYQQEDVDKLARQKYALVGSEMGSGKSVIGTALDSVRREQAVEQAPTLVVAPLSVLNHWERHFHEMTDLKVQVVNPKKRDAFLDVEAQVFICHWDVLRLMPELTKQQWLHVIADECHRAQDRKAQQTQALKRIPAVYKTALSGTPITNTPDKLWSILHWLDPKEWSSYWRFFGKYVHSETTPQGYRKILGSKNEAELHERIAPFYIRHLKKSACCPHHPHGVMPWLPEKFYSDPIMVDLEGKQKRAYDEMRKNSLAWVGAHEDAPLAASVVVAQLTRLQQFTDGYAEIDLNGNVRLAEPSVKLDALMQILSDNPSDQFVVFTQFSQMVDLIDARLIKAGISFSRLTGDVPHSKRGALVQDFQQGRTRLFISTIGAGGVGIDLYAANKVIFVDRSWSPAINLQAEDRLHRDGQKNAVQVIDIMARNTVDMGKAQKLEHKWSAIKKLLGDS